ncbi:MAG: DUF1549 domain-containing protein [Planctomycetaceae bacterium]
MRWKLLLPGVVLLAVIWLVNFVTHQPLKGIAIEESAQPTAGIDVSVEKVNTFFTRRWASEELQPVSAAEELTVLRRITLALMGTVPSLEEIRAFEQDSGPHRLQRWTARFLHDRRYSEYFAERLARSFVGVEGGQFIVYRRDRFLNWLSEQLEANRPYPDLVREMIAGDGLWTDEPEVNFLMAAYDDGEGFNKNKLAGRAVRAFLGQRIDCAQCHDHPFDHWKQNEFAGLAAHFGQLKLSPVGVREDRDLKFEVEDRDTLEKKVVEPSVPFGANWEPSEGTRRTRLATWVTHPENRRLERAIVNRVWGLLFGRAWIEPVDDLPDPPGEQIAGPDVEGAKHPKSMKAGEQDLLDLLGADFREHKYDLRRLIEVIIASQPFLLESKSDIDDASRLDRLKEHFAIFPLTRLRPEQIIGSLLQASSLTTVDQNSHLISRFIKLTRSNDFVKEYGDLGENELEDRAGTIPQALLRMNGNLINETIDATPFTASGRISQMAPDDTARLELCYLVCLTRRPTAEESAYFLPVLEATRPKRRGLIVEDLYWTLFNSPEFAWNH